MSKKIIIIHIGNYNSYGNSYQGMAGNRNSGAFADRYVPYYAQQNA